MKIKTKITLALLLTALVPLVGASVASYLVARGSLREQELNQLESIASIQKSRLENLISQDLERLALIQSRTLLRADLQAYNRTGDQQLRTALDQILLDARSSSASFREIHLLGMDGTVIASTDPAMVGTSQAGEDFFEEGKSSDSLDIFFHDDQGDLMHYLAGPLTLDGETIGVLAVESDAGDLTALTGDYTGLGKSGETVLAHSTPEGDALFITPLRFDKNASLKLVIPRERANVPITRGLAGQDDLVTEAVDYRGVPVLAAIRYIDGPGWGLVVKIDASEAFAPVNSLGLFLLVLLVLVCLIVVASSMLISRAITRPVAGLTDTALAIRAGDLSKRAEITTSDEIGALASAFNEMTDDLVDAKADLERKVEERTAELELANTELEGYAHTVSHDIKGPLSAVNLAASLLNDHLEGCTCGQSHPELREAADVILRNTEKAFLLIDDVLVLAEAGQVPANVSSVDISEILQRILDERSKALEERRVNVVLSPDLGRVSANATQIYQLFSNLLGNAIKHNTDPHPEITVSYLGEGEDGAHRYIVRDNGPGIRHEDMDRIFIPFFKGATGETGVGLATVDKIVKIYGGTIRAYNDDGACFEFTLFDFDEGRAR
jgi:signal transduction histidine kinase